MNSCTECNQDFPVRPRKCSEPNGPQCLCFDCHVTHMTTCQPCQKGGFEAPVVSRDAEGYTTSFKVDEVEAIVNFFWEFGFVVVRDVIPPEFVEATKEDIWKKVHGVNPNKPESFLTANWRIAFGSSYNTKRGFLGYDAATSQAAWNNRQHPDMYKVFVNILQQKNLWVKLDRYGFMRPTKGIIEEGGEKVDKPDWETDDRFVHWDQNPWREPDFCRVQGVLAISDHTITSGGFHCIPGFTKYFSKWAAANEHLKDEGSLIDFPWSDPALQGLTKITLRPGSIVVWDSRTPHDFSRATLTELGRKIAGVDLYEPEDCQVSPVVRGGFYNDEQLY